MVIDGIKGRFGAGGERAHTTSHPPIIKSGKFKAGNGQLAAGLVLARDAESLLIPYTAADGEAMVGVLDHPLDTASETVGEYVVHGTVKDRLLTKDGAALDGADLLKLYEIGIYAE